MALVEGVLIHALTVSFLLDPWNPWVAFLPFLAFLLATAAIVVGDLAVLPVAVVTGTFAVQAHLGYVPLVVALSLIGAGAMSLRAIQRARGSGLGRALARRRALLAASAVLAVLLWLPPVIQQLTGRRGNFSALVHYFRNPGEPAAGWRFAVGVLGRQLAPAGPWLTGHDTSALGFLATASVLPALGVMVLVAVLGLFALHRGNRRPAIFTGLVLICDAVGLFATVRVTGLLADYLVRRWWALAACTCLAGMWSAVALAALWLRRVTKHVQLAGLVAVIAAGFLAAAGTAPAEVPHRTLSQTSAHLVAAITPVLDSEATYRVDTVDSVDVGAVSTGVTVQLMLLGYSVFAQPNESLEYGRWRTGAVDSATQILTVVNGEDLRSDWSPPSGAQLIASFDPLSPTERLSFVQAASRVRAALYGRVAPGPLPVGTPFARWVLAEKGASPRDVELLATLHRRGDAYFVYLSPAGRQQ